MKKLIIGNKAIVENSIYVIAEIGCNHNGDFDRACKMVHKAAECGADAVKFQKRYNEELFIDAELDKPYENENAYGKTYREHRQALDWFDKSEFSRLKNLSAALGLSFIVTPFEWKSARFCEDIGVDAFKIASCDLNNHPLVKQIASYGRPIILSTGGATPREIDATANILSQLNPDFAILHCVSLYPNGDKDLNLVRIKQLSYRYVDNFIGFSSHHPSILACINAYWMNARIFEVHFTLNRADRGTDHGFSLEPEGLRRLCFDLKRIPVMVGTGERNPAERDGFVKKFGKSVYTMVCMDAGMTIKRRHLGTKIEVKAPKIGICASKMEELIGKKLKNNKLPGEVFTEDDFD